MDHSGEFEWRGDGEEAEVVVYAPDAEAARRGFERAMRAASLPGARSPVYVVSSSPGEYGHAVVSESHVAPDLASAPGRAVLLCAEGSAADFARNLGVSPEEVRRELPRRLGEARYSLPRLNAAGVRRMCEYGALAAAGSDVISEDDLSLLTPFPEADPDSIGGRAIAGGGRDWDVAEAKTTALAIAEILDRDALDDLGLEPEQLVIHLEVGRGELGRLAFASHRERVRERVLGGAFDRVGDGSTLYAAPRDTEEAQDFLTASAAASNFADSLASLAIFILRRALRDVAGGLSVRASWRVGGASRDGAATKTIHREGLASVAEGEAVFCGYTGGEDGGVLSRGTGGMYGSGPAFAMRETRSPWQECGLLEEIAVLGPPGLPGG